MTVKYLGLLGLPGVMKTHPKLVAEHKDTILRCLEDDDITIRMRALDLLDGIVRVDISLVYSCCSVDTDDD